MPFTADKPAGGDALAVSDDAIRENFRNVSPARDLFAEGFVQSGIETSINGSNQARLDVTAGIAYVKQTSSSDVLRYDKETTFFTTSVASTTYYLDLNEDGTYNWDTSHSSDSNYLPIAEVTTDSAGDISSLTDVRDIKPLLDMVLEDASKIAFDDTSFGADTAAVSDVAAALNLLGGNTIVEHNLDVSSPAGGRYIRWDNGFQLVYVFYEITDISATQTIQKTISVEYDDYSDFPYSYPHVITSIAHHGAQIGDVDLEYSRMKGIDTIETRITNSGGSTQGAYFHSIILGTWK